MQERQAKVESEFTALATYEVVQKLMDLLKNGQIHKNDDVVNKSITKFIERVCDYMGAEWLFFKMDTLMVFNSLL